MNPERTHKTHVATSSRQTAFNSRENASSLRATLPGLLLAACLMAAFNAHGAGLGPIFPLEGGTRLATRPDGTTVIVYPITLGTFPNTFPYVMVGQIPVNGQPQGPFVPFPTDTANSFSVYEPDVAVNATNGVIVFSDYVSINPGDPDEYQIGYQFVDTNGLPGGPRLVAAGTESWITDFIVPRVSMNRSGQFAMVWFDQDYLPSHYARGRVFNASGQPIGTGNITLNDQPRSDGYFNAYNPAVAIAPNGSSVYVWEDAFRSKGPGYTDYEDIGHDIYARRVDSTGNPIGSQFRVNSTDNCRHSNAEIAMATNGSFVVVWLQSSSDADGVYLQRFDAAGTRIGQEMRVSPFNGIDPQAAMTADGRFVLAWQGQDVDGNGNGIFAQRFLADGSFYGKTLWINEGTTNSPYQPLLGLADDGTFIMKWIEYTNNFASVNNTR
ncbi:MAG: hypothetical protein NT154_30880 [Verrucomicrobia bacterium]|nr:hypothetical protein [Verrucomicrobiota bacterium]